jgi:S23 ribosomal protein.
MALYENLPVFKASYDVLLSIYALSRNMQREYRYTIGEKLKTELMDMMVNIYKANSITDKSSVIQQARESLVVIKLHLRILRDLKQISVKSFALLSERIESLSKQLALWHKYSKNKEKIANKSSSKSLKGVKSFLESGL